MKTASFTFGLLVGILVTAFIFASLKPGAGGSAQTVLKAVHSLPTNHPVHKGIEHFARRVEAYSQGSIRVEIFPNGQLGAKSAHWSKYKKVLWISPKSAPQRSAISCPSHNYSASPMSSGIMRTTGPYSTALSASNSSKSWRPMPPASPAASPG